MFSNSAAFSTVSAQIGKLNKEKKNLFLKSKSVQKYVASGQYNQICLEDTMSGLYQIIKMYV